MYSYVFCNPSVIIDLLDLKIYNNQQNTFRIVFKLSQRLPDTSAARHCRSVQDTPVVLIIWICNTH